MGERAELTPVEAAVHDAITASMNEPDGWSEARKLIASLDEAGFSVVPKVTWGAAFDALMSQPLNIVHIPRKALFDDD